MSTASTVAGSFGQRDLAATMTQRATDRTQQFANAARNRRASIVHRDDAAGERGDRHAHDDQLQPHARALGAVLRGRAGVPRVTTVARVDKCLFVPMKVIAAFTPELVRRYRDALVAATPEPHIRRALQEGTDLAEIRPLLPDVPPNFVRREPEDLLRSQLEAARGATGEPVAAGIHDTWKLPAGTRLLGLTAKTSTGTVATIVLTLRDGSTREFTGTPAVTHSVEIDEPIAATSPASPSSFTTSGGRRPTWWTCSIATTRRSARSTSACGCATADLDERAQLPRRRRLPAASACTTTGERRTSPSTIATRRSWGGWRSSPSMPGFDWVSFEADGESGHVHVSVAAA